MPKICLWDRILIDNQQQGTNNSPLLKTQLSYLQSTGVNILNLDRSIPLDNNLNESIIYSSDIILAHIDDASREQLLNKEYFPENCIDKQIFILISSKSVEGNSCFLQAELSTKKSRIVLFTNSIDVLQIDSVFQNVMNLSFEDAGKIIKAQSAYTLGWDADPFFPTPDIPIAVYILCQCYLHLHYSQSKQSQETTHPQILELLKSQELFDRPSDDKFTTAKSSNWWKKSLTSDSSEDLSWDKIQSKGKKQWQSLIKGQDDLANAWDDLISQVNEEEDVEISFKNVEAYYLKMHTILSAK